MKRQMVLIIAGLFFVVGGFTGCKKKKAEAKAESEKAEKKEAEKEQEKAEKTEEEGAAAKKKKE